MSNFNIRSNIVDLECKNVTVNILYMIRYIICCYSLGIH